MKTRFLDWSEGMGGQGCLAIQQHLVGRTLQGVQGRETREGRAKLIHARETQLSPGIACHYDTKPDCSGSAAVF